MRFPFNARAPAFDAKAINDTIQRALASAGLDTTSGPMRSVTETIRQALASAGVADTSSPPAASAVVIDVTARVVDAGQVGEIASKPGLRRARYSGPGASRHTNSTTPPVRARTSSMFLPGSRMRRRCS